MNVIFQWDYETALLAKGDDSVYFVFNIKGPLPAKALKHTHLKPFCMAGNFI